MLRHLPSYFSDYGRPFKQSICATEYLQVIFKDISHTIIHPCFTYIYLPFVDNFYGKMIGTYTIIYHTVRYG